MKRLAIFYIFIIYLYVHLISFFLRFITYRYINHPNQVDIGTHLTSSGVDYYTINPKGNVPCLVLDDGTILNENVATLQYIADQVPGTVAPVAGTQERAVMQNALAYVASEVHATVAHLFNKDLSADTRAYLVKKYASKLQYVNDHLLATKMTLTGTKFYVADAYLNIVLSWCPYVGVDLASYPNLIAYVERFNTHPKVGSLLFYRNILHD